MNYSMHILLNLLRKKFLAFRRVTTFSHAIKELHTVEDVMPHPHPCSGMMNLLLVFTLSCKSSLGIESASAKGDCFTQGSLTCGSLHQIPIIVAQSPCPYLNNSKGLTQLWSSQRGPPENLFGIISLLFCPILLSPYHYL